MGLLMSFAVPIFLIAVFIAEQYLRRDLPHVAEALARLKSDGQDTENEEQGIDNDVVTEEIDYLGAVQTRGGGRTPRGVLNPTTPSDGKGAVACSKMPSKFFRIS